MPALWILLTLLATAGASATGYYLLGPDASKQRTECVEKMTEALDPSTVNSVKAIVRQCRERFPD
ncbi:hypothetical protein [Chromatocurvus halotolerans]|uniref:Uncharacterized protein n=1 Tax=Chromatocurvus halotolerans TaxID=1132028 RepID=A0A4R2KMB7_9GAMM|nr:hypothetical protein [Chromatocurvus halotolerans]TCO73687.1 hypothetical protein EV688_1153 [Chromatocurvus halotolerans]